jgi:CBS domain-containing protein
LTKAKKAAAQHDSNVLLTGILPTLTLKHMGVENMTPIPRYFALNEAIKESRRQAFDIHIHGVDEVNLLHDSVMLEGCNTSFQIHLQVDPDEFVSTYNWAQAIAGPVLSVCTNSPLLFGKELWSETRIALFAQSVDTRANAFLLNERQARVSFGEHWATGSIADIFRDNVSRFRSLLNSNFDRNSMDMLDDGKIPKLRALNLHNGTVYRWNRPCYGVGDAKPHLRIENRYIPSGPTVTDEIANMAFWVGVMKGRPKKYDNINQKMDFKDVKFNFFNAARYGIATQFYWNNEYIPSEKLIMEELLPMAYRGLYSVGISPKDAEKYLTVIENRLKSRTGSQWMVRSYRNLLKHKKRFEAVQILTENLYKKQEKDFPVCTWSLLNEHKESTVKAEKVVKHIMSTDIFSVGEKDSVALVLSIMRWKNIHHMPVINDKKELVGLISWKDIEDLEDCDDKKNEAVEAIMTKEIITTNEFEQVINAKAIMDSNNIHSLPVIKEGKLIGIVTSNDILN